MSTPPKFNLPKRIQREYAAGIRQITGRILQPKLPEQSLSDWLKSMVEVSKREDIQAASTELAKRMVQWTHASNMKTWRAAAAKSTNARKFYTLLQKELTGTATGARVSTIVRENAAHISSLPLEAALTLTDEVTKAQQSGVRAGTIDKMMRTRFPELLRSRVQLISRTETSKASSALTRARAEDLGIDAYLWESSQDGDRVRHSHQKMQGVLVFWTDPPAPDTLFPVPLKGGGHAHSTLGHYHAGDCPNCRCYSAPILNFDDIDFPAKVYYAGAIHQMNKQQFKTQFANSQLLAA